MALLRDPFTALVDAGALTSTLAVGTTAAACFVGEAVRLAQQPYYGHTALFLGI
ncbi:hypothetical protein DPMN_030778 [Dreissena polymorpha]|uniref:Uncharacterized protein n=1 Tax=Dreissena polymorpha TaxID=45954 RepID=A0A9D4RGH4_DREPO|nr:hypothetical protein DPMN_030778 [Dreissena polymorpha]